MERDRKETLRAAVSSLSNYQRGQVWEVFNAMQAEIDSLTVFKRVVEEALNSGDGVYRP